MHTDPIADMLTRIRNAHHARKEFVRVPASKLKRAILEVLEKNGYVKAVKEAKTEGFPEFIVSLDTTRPLSLTRISKPGQRIYSSGKELKKVLNGLGIAIVSTSQGIMTNAEARQKGIGGEILCEIY